MTNRTPPEPDHTPEIRDAIEAHVHRLLEHTACAIADGQVETIDQCREQLADLLRSDGTETLGISVDDQLGLVEEHADDMDLQLDSVDIGTLRFQIDAMAARIIGEPGEQAAWEELTRLEEIMNRHDLSIEDLKTTNHLAHLPHATERSEGDGCTVLEYRDVDGFDIAVHEVRLAGGLRLYFQRLTPR